MVLLRLPLRPKTCTGHMHPIGPRRIPPVTSQRYKRAPKAGFHASKSSRSCPVLLVSRRSANGPLPKKQLTSAVSVGSCSSVATIGNLTWRRTTPSENILTLAHLCLGAPRAPRNSSGERILRDTLIALVLDLDVDLLLVLMTVIRYISKPAITSAICAGIASPAETRLGGMESPLQVSKESLAKLHPQAHRRWLLETPGTWNSRGFSRDSCAMVLLQFPCAHQILQCRGTPPVSNGSAIISLVLCNISHVWSARIPRRWSSVGHPFSFYIPLMSASPWLIYGKPCTLYDYAAMLASAPLCGWRDLQPLSFLFP